MRLKPRPRIVGFDCPEPMLIAFTPGMLLSVCMRLPAKLFCRNCLSMLMVLTDERI